jgi:hypothetical protein
MMMPEINAQRAIADLKARTLSAVPGPIAKLLCLAGARDCNTGEYHHDGLAFRFTAAAAQRALEVVHQELFEQVALSRLAALTGDLEQFVRSSCSDPERTLGTWKKLHPYRILVPLDADPVLCELFFSNVRMALAIVEERLKRSFPEQLSA